MHRLLWIVQALLAALFLFAGAMKLLLPLEMMTRQMPLPGWFLRFTGIAEVLGALGLILPGILRIRPGLTPVAAGGLTVVMLGATASHRQRRRGRWTDGIAPLLRSRGATIPTLRLPPAPEPRAGSRRSAAWPCASRSRSP
jgi:uncharacterized membrane protein YphA (DoxX/SURF4 family)